MYENKFKKVFRSVVFFFVLCRLARRQLVTERQLTAAGTRA
jgi:hypothetical protein